MAKDAQMFIQIGCVLAVEEISNRQVIGLAMACIAVFVGLYVIVQFDFMKQVASNEYLEWDLKTITAGDYSIEFDLEKKFYIDWLNTEYLNWFDS